MGWIGMDCIHQLHYVRLFGFPFRGDTESYQFTPVCSEKLDFYALAGIMGEIGLLLAGWDGRTGHTRWDGGGMEVPSVGLIGFEAPPLDLGVRRAVGSGGCHQFHQCCRGGRVFVSVQQNNHNVLNQNPNFFYSKK